ncbi:MAG: L-2-amino-thiazoline-4-carboxylic acid hydrolase, partial [Synergistota bacterium]|nr:L-2-amino-thiazoline-4-carboxylic acid hydrolase [Synergistota bacterium]
IFEMDVVESTDDRFVVEFHFCPLVRAWTKLTDNEEEIAHLCDIAMDGDRGIVSRFPDFRMELKDTIASGGKVCRLVITRKKNS